MSPDAPGHGRPHLRVRYYPRRVARPPVAEPLSPGQALHLVNDPQRAALARHTAEGHELQPPVPQPVPVPAPVHDAVPAAPAAPARPAVATAEPAAFAPPPPAPAGRLRRWWQRFTTRNH